MGSESISIKRSNIYYTIIYPILIMPNGPELSGADLDEHEARSTRSWRLPLERVVMREQG
jgi:hypothetical protein